MATPLERSRTGCALHGALFSAAAVKGVVPILHATAGCGFQAYRLGLAGGGGGPDPAGGLAAASSNISEKQVVFGGTARLREQIKNAVKVVDGALPVVLSGCATEMVGDDIPAMVRESREQGEATIAIATAGFRGSAYAGYELFLKGVVAQLGEAGTVRPDGRRGTVNLLGLVPRQDPFWEAELDELARLLDAIGLEANTLFGLGGGVEGLRDLAAADLSLVLSPWGQGVARDLEQRFGVPWFDTGGLPVGARATAAVLFAVAGRLGLERPTVAAVVDAEVRREAHYLARLADAYYRDGLQRDFALVAGSAYAAGVTGFLTDSLGWLPRLIVITDQPPPDARTGLDQALDRAAGGLGPEILFSEDAAEIADAVGRRDPEIILGSALEREVADALKVPLVEVSFPVTGRLVLDKGLAGPRGALALIEEVVRAIRADGNNTHA